MYENGNGLSAADVAAVTGRGGYGGFGGYGDGGMFWIIILFLFAMMGGWGNWGGNNNGCGNIPYGYVQNGVQDGFNQQAVMAGISGLQTTVANGFANAEVNECNRAMQIQNNFAQLGLAGVQGFNNVTNGISDLKYTVATENCADRTQSMQNTRDIMENCNRNNQAILDKLCQLELDGFKRENDNLRTQLNMAALRESQTAQNAFIQQGFSNEVDQLYNRLNNCPVPCTPVYGRTPIFTCNNNGGCNCGGSF